MCRTAFLFLASLCLTWPARAQDTTADDEKLLAGAGVKTDGPALLAFFKKRVPDADAARKAETLVEQLGSPTFKVRQKASEGLIALGPPARPALLAVLKGKELEVRRRAEECLAAIDRTASPELEGAAVRLLRARQPAGACAALLAYLPSAVDATVREEVLAVLLALGVPGGKADPALVAALADKDAGRRAAAALVLGAGGTEAQRAKVRALLDDKAPLVRLRAAQGLLAARDKKALPALLPLVSEAPPEVAELAHDVLSGLAGEKAPDISLGGDAAARKKCRAAWETWWKEHGKGLDLAKADVGLPGVGGNQRARAVTMQFINALLKGDMDAVYKTVDFPLSFAGVFVFKTRQEFEMMLGPAFKNMPQRPKVDFTPPRVIDLNAFLRTPAGAKMKDFLAQHKGAQLRAVSLTGTQMGRTETAIFLVRLRGGQARVIGLADTKGK